MNASVHHPFGLLLAVATLLAIAGCESAVSNSSPNQPLSSSVRALYRQAEKVAQTSMPQATDLIEQGLKLAQSEQNLLAEAEGYLLLADLYRLERSDLNYQRLAVNHYLKAAALCEERPHPACAAYAHYHAGVGFLVFKDHEQAILYLLKALARYEVMGDSTGAMLSQLRLSDAFWGNGSWSVSYDYAKSAEQMASANLHDSALVRSLIRQGDFHLREEDYDQSQQNYQKALGLLESQGAPSATLIVLDRLARVNILRKQLGAAQRYLGTALALAVRVDQPEQEAELLGLKAELALAQQRYSQVPSLLDSSLAIAQRYQMADLLLKNRQRYISFYLHTNQSEGLPQQWQQFDALQDSVDRLERRDLTQRLNAQFDVQKQSYQIGLLQEQRKTQAAELENQRYQIQFAIAIGLFLLLLAGILYQQYRSKRRINQQLESLVARRTEELRFANRDLKEVNKELDTFAYRTAHDIRGPVARLLGLCQLALHEDRDGDATRYLAMINQEAIQMDFMLHRFLEVSSIKHLHGQPKPLNLIEELASVIEEMAELDGFHAIRFHLDVMPGLEVVADPVLVRIALKNLIENAIIFHRRDIPDPFVEIQALSLNGDMELRILDNGIGIAPEVAPRIFEMFYRGTTLSKGLGLGLYATQLAAHSLSGSVRLNTQQKEGTEFILRMPRSQPMIKPQESMP
jgi:signal transduction histidine kinase